MVKLYKSLFAFALLLLTSLPVQAQDAAFEQPTSSLNGGAGPAASGAVTQPVPQQPMASAGQGTNLRHWSRFSGPGASSPFVRVPAGTRVRQNVSHYVRPQWVEPGSVPMFNQPKKHVPAPAVTVVGSHKVAPATSNKKAMHKQTLLMGYGKKGEVTYTPVSHKWSGTAISYYGRYH